ncbi:hypothetical protein JXB01_03225 [Candidatus Micrarchaeota archaeon]|nr:hypothetical protein [Candidatus Micrarchaeota archaeon]
MKCSRCGMEANSYGNDGLPYCDSCLFYGMNKQCQRCGMYLPSTELQMYRGQWYCQYCVMDLRDEHREKYEPGELKREEPSARKTYKVIEEHCERCGRPIRSVVYYFKGKKLCEVCLEREKDEHGGPTIPPVAKFRIGRQERPILAPILVPLGKAGGGILSFILALFGLKKKKPEKEAEVVEVYKKKSKTGKKGFTKYKKD